MEVACNWWPILRDVSRLAQWFGSFGSVLLFSGLRFSLAGTSLRMTKRKSGTIARESRGGEFACLVLGVRHFSCAPAPRAVAQPSEPPRRS